MKFLTLVSFLILCLTANAVNRCHYLHEEKVVESLIETVGELIGELEIASSSSVVLVSDYLSQDIERLLQELSYILDLFAEIDKNDVDLTTKDTNELKGSNAEYSKSLKDLEAWNEINAKKRRKRQTDPSLTLTDILKNISSTNSGTAATLENQAYPNLDVCPVCGTLIPLSSAYVPSSTSAPGFASGSYLDNSVVFPGVAYLPSCDGNRPARVSRVTAYSPCAFQEMIGANGSYYCNHPALEWITTNITNAFTTFGALTVTRTPGDQFFVARFNFTKDGLTYSTIGYYFIYDFSIEFWDGTQAVQGTDYPYNFDILTCHFRSDLGGPPIYERIPCRWSQTNITDPDGNYLKTNLAE